LPVFKIQHLFSSCKNGFSETWYADADTRTAARIRGDNMALARRYLLATPNIIEAMRVTEITLNRTCSLVPFPPYSAVQTAASDVIWNGWQIEVMATGGYCRQWIARGMPDDWIKRDTGDLCLFPKPTALTDAFNTFKSQFLLQVPALRVILDPPEGPAPIAIGAPITAGVLGGTKFPIPALVGEPGKTVKFTNWTGPDQRLLNGVFRILSNAGGIVEVNIPFAAILDPTGDVGGKAWAQVIAYKPIEDIRLVRPSSRATGRAFFVRRGRRKART